LQKDLILLDLSFFIFFMQEKKLTRGVCL
jgi:hypothetical protein